MRRGPAQKLTAGCVQAAMAAVPVMAVAAACCLLSAATIAVATAVPSSSTSGNDTAYIVTAVADPEPLLAFRTGHTSWQQVFNPTWVAPTNATQGRAGLLVRSQNCTLAEGKCGHCSGTGQKASWLTWAELDESGPVPKVVNFVGESEAVFGPFDCADGAQCLDARGTEDPRLTYDPETQTYVLLYNAWGAKGAFLAIASTRDPTKRDGWTRHGTIFPEDAHLDGWPGKSGSIVWMPSGSHYVIWGCARELRITPSIGRSLFKWDSSKTKVLFGVRKAPLFDTGFVESAMPPLVLSNGNLLFFHDSVGTWNKMGGFQSGWVVLSGKDPTVVLARSSVPPLPYTLPWMKGVKPWSCNVANVANLGGGHPIEGKNDSFRIYFGGADTVLGSAVVSVQLAPKSGRFGCSTDAGGLTQCLPTNSSAAGSSYPSFDACEKACVPKVRLKTDCDLTGRWTGVVSGQSGPLIVINQTGNAFKASAPGNWDATTTGGIAVGSISADGTSVHGHGGWTHDKTTPWTLRLSVLQPGDPPCSKLTTVNAAGQPVAAWCRHTLTPTHCGVPDPPPFDGCPNQAFNKLVAPEDFGKIFPASATKVGVSFKSSDATLQGAYDHAISCEDKNVKEFLPGLDCVVEGSGYKNVWLETQPMAGAMWAVRNVTKALANQLVFMRTQREDGRLPGMVTTNNSAGAENPMLTAVYCFPKQSLLQGDYFSSTSVDLAFYLNISDKTTATEYTKELHGVLERFDDWMWTNRRSSLPGKSDALWCPSAADWGGDGYDGYRGHPAPFVSMDMMAYAHSNALALSRTSSMLGNASGAAHWTTRAGKIAESLERVLWIEERGACFDIDADDHVVDVLVHNNLRAMWHGVFSQRMADIFVARHLRNTSEFWTAFPLPSIAANDPKFQPGLPRNSWSGPSEGLTYQRAIRALENYGYHTEITLLGAKLLDAVEKTPGYRFPQQWNPSAYNGTPPGAPGPGDCYGPALLSLLEYNTYARGIKPRPADGVLMWSDAILSGRQAATSTFTQTLGSHELSLVAKASEPTFSGSCDAKKLFTATRGVRVLTALDGTVLGIVGISATSIDLILSADGTVTKGRVEPNSEYELDGSGGLKLTRQVPFANPSVGHDLPLPAGANECSDLVSGRVLGSARSFHRTKADTAAQCCQLCAAAEGCAAFNFEATERQGCFFQADANPCASRNCSKPGAVSGVVHGGDTPSANTTTTITLGHVYHHVDPKFKCWNVDPSENREWETRNLSRSAPGGEKLYALSKASLPGYLRFGGAGADSFAYQIPGGPKPYMDCDNLPPDAAKAAEAQVWLGKQPPHCLNTTWLLNLLEFADASGASLIFGLDINARDNATGRWDPAPARALIQFATARGHKFFGFELGNEQDGAYTAASEAADFLVLQQLLVDLFPNAASRPKIIGPDTHGWHGPPADPESDSKLQFLRNFTALCKSLGVDLFAVTHHEYIEIPESSTTPPPASKLDLTGSIASAVNASLAPSGVPIWAGEIGPHNGGSVPCDSSSERWANFADTFWYLDAMGSKSSNGYSAFCRQDFIGIDYAMLDCATNDPLPDYFGGVLWSKLMGTGVVRVASSSSVRAYAHCHATNPADLTVLLINLEPDNRVSKPQTVVIGDGTAATEEYHLTGPNGTAAQTVALNGAVLQATAEGVLPAMVGRVGVAKAVVLAPASIAFVVAKGLGAAVGCTA